MIWYVIQYIKGLWAESGCNQNCNQGRNCDCGVKTTSCKKPVDSEKR